MLMYSFKIAGPSRKKVPCDHCKSVFIAIMGTEAIMQWDNLSVGNEEF